MVDLSFWLHLLFLVVLELDRVILFIGRGLRFILQWLKRFLLLLDEGVVHLDIHRAFLL